MIISVYTDGGSRGNPGVSGYGLVIYDENKNIIFQQSKFLGVKTNNEAEYLALIAALSWINENLSHLQISQVNLFSDSQLIVRQVLGQYKIKAVHLKSLHATVLQLLSQINLPYHYTDVPRETNQLADKLANQAMDQK